jgi:Dual-action HEIGH metallo-peptidase
MGSMKVSFYTFFVFICLFLSCSKQEKIVDIPVSIPAKDLEKIFNLGFSTSNVLAYGDGYIIENDIFIHRDSLDKMPASTTTLRIAQSEQYRTYNVVKVPRTISISGELLGNKMDASLDTMINRYNKLNLNLKFRRVASDGYIKLYPKYDFAGTTLASAGFPDAEGNPYRSVLVNMNVLKSLSIQAWGVVMQHEVGHCIGFRHTDYMNRAYSCGSGINEGASTVGAILIPGTPAEPNAESFMLACFNGDGNRTFNPNDIIAMKYLFK